MIAEQVEPHFQRIRRLHVAPGCPERRVVAFRQFIVHDDEIPDVLDLGARLCVKQVGNRVGDAIEGEHLHQSRRTELHQVDIGRFKRLDEAARQAESDAVLVPDLVAPARAELDMYRLIDQRPL